MLSAAPSALADLVERFERNADSYRAAQYNETQLRNEFLDPLFEILGWDVNNTRGYAEAFKDVIHEDAIKVGGATKAPDYCFRIGGQRKFFLEAKKPAVNIKDDVNPAFQLRRYAWSAKLPLSILTDFEEFAVYDCRAKPAQSDGAATGACSSPSRASAFHLARALGSTDIGYSLSIWSRFQSVHLPATRWRVRRGIG